ncbi:DUF3040 domain-containing protein [Pseudonocardia broussonetiae]|uniref:DUF3040 domain-containing protein n=1 Tax=Pseudonocardia broussonetiae TaxID=2736640 RepID=A0A6M6JQB4_9PSEU|nr:DUF3040 domain-containing protein [Pseudonocardia broussonetiae]QJY49187.1 DUF3040 domain-containing protein [Pseudonocardia broussonetiae]
MLSHEEERRLQAIEQQMRDEDPDFVRRFGRRTDTLAAALHRARAIAVKVVLGLLTALGVLIGIAGLLTASLALFFTGSGLAGVSAYQLRRVRRRRCGR